MGKGVGRGQASNAGGIEGGDGFCTTTITGAFYFSCVPVQQIYRRCHIQVGIQMTCFCHVPVQQIYRRCDT